MQPSSAKPNLKSGNYRWLAAVAGLDFVLLSSISRLARIDGVTVRQWAAPAVLPVVLLLLNNLLPSATKNIIVFWRFRHVLPGHRAFSHFAKTDPRFDTATLRKLIGPFPIKPEIQNSKWYSLYKQVETAPAVVDAHRSFLLFRDVASLSLMMLVASPFLLLAVGEPKRVVYGVLGLFAAQYFLAMLACRVSSGRLVRNVLAEHAAVIRPGT